MTKKEYFQQAIWLDKEIKTLLQEHGLLKDMILRYPYLPPMPPNVRAQLEKLAPRLDEIRLVIDSLPSQKEQFVMRSRYLCGMKWQDVAAVMDADPRSVRRWHKLALEHANIPVPLPSSGLRETPDATPSRSQS